jgi:hypothetical protein
VTRRTQKMQQKIMYAPTPCPPIAVALMVESFNGIALDRLALFECISVCNWCPPTPTQSTVMLFQNYFPPFFLIFHETNDLSFSSLPPLCNYKNSYIYKNLSIEVIKYNGRNNINRIQLGRKLRRKFQRWLIQF